MAAAGHIGPAHAVLRLPPALPSRQLTVPILMYHRIDVLRPGLPPMTRRLTIDPRDFAGQICTSSSTRAPGSSALVLRRLEVVDNDRRPRAPLPPVPALLTTNER